jgi:hypothetical protein
MLKRETRVTLVCAPAGSGKSALLASWLGGRTPVAWVGVERDECDATRFWSSVADAPRRSGAAGPWFFARAIALGWIAGPAPHSVMGAVPEERRRR